MSVRTVLRKIMASSLGLLLVSCSAAKPMAAARGPTGPHELGRFVLFVQEMQDGRVMHAWKPLKDFDLKRYSSSLRTVGIGGSIKRTSTSMDDERIGDACIEVWERCMKRCKSSPLPPHATHYIASRKSVRSALDAYCTDECRKESDDCRRRLSRRAEGVLEFRAIGEAVDWLKRHKEEIVVGASVVIAGVVFYAIMSSGGVLILAPVLLLASPDAPAEPHIAEAFQ